MHKPAKFKRHQPKQTARGISKTIELTLPDTIRGRVANSFQVLGVKHWNSLPTTIRNLPSLSRFTAALLKHFGTKESRLVGP